eukprot:5627483-Prymnesium_polylepis.1
MEARRGAAVRRREMAGQERCHEPASGKHARRAVGVVRAVAFGAAASAQGVAMMMGAPAAKRRAWRCLRGAAWRGRSA